MYVYVSLFFRITLAKLKKQWKMEAKLLDTPFGHSWIIITGAQVTGTNLLYSQYFCVGSIQYLRNTANIV